MIHAEEPLVAPSLNDWDPKGVWTAYVPDLQAPWNLRRVVHLHRRAGFASTWHELQRDLTDGPAKSIDRLLQGSAREGVPDTFATVAENLAARADAADRSGLRGDDGAALKAWWFYRMYAGSDPLGERLTLLWHNHFATSNEKVRDAAAMRRQNELFRRLGRGPFGELLSAVAHDPATMLYLDASANKKGYPNENLGRELMELFTIGVGNYTEADVKDAARALTGWTVKNGAFQVWPGHHDDGQKTVLSKTGRWTGDDLIKILLDHPGTARRLAWRICHWLMGEKGVDVTAIDTLAAGLGQHNLDIGWAVQIVLRSRAFFATSNLGNRVPGPAEFVVGIARALECFDPPPSSLLLAEWSARLGQDVFYPPNVFGWPEGRAWLTTGGIIGRANYASALVLGRVSAYGEPLDIVVLAGRHNRNGNLEDLISFLAELLTGSAPDPGWAGRIMTALGSRAKVDPDSARVAAALVAASPEVQMS
jgi:uncharacterized protein (DUF1800 family)